jgi:hypothetical protein
MNPRGTIITRIDNRAVRPVTKIAAAIPAVCTDGESLREARARPTALATPATAAATAPTTDQAGRVMLAIARPAKHSAGSEKVT